MNQKYFDICNRTVADLMNTDQGDLETANNTLSRLLVENTDLKMFLYSTGKFFEYAAWIKRFKEKNKGIENMIKDNLDIEETCMYCRDCKFYKYDRTDEIINENIYEVIKKIKRGTCSNGNIRNGWELENTGQLIYHDSEDYSAALYVGEMFGCVHFKEKE